MATVNLSRALIWGSVLHGLAGLESLLVTVGRVHGRDTNGRRESSEEDVAVRREGSAGLDTGASSSSLFLSACDHSIYILCLCLYIDHVLSTFQVPCVMLSALFLHTLSHSFLTQPCEAGLVVSICS